MTMEECKARAKQEFDYYLASEGLQSAIRNGLISMASDLRKVGNPDGGLISLCILQIPLINSRQQFINFINGFN